MVWTELTDALTSALERLGLATPQRVQRLELVVPRDASHGDWTTNLALWLGKEVGQSPRALAQALAEHLPRRPDLFDPPEIAGPGFLNFRYSAAFVDGLPSRIVAAGDGFGAFDHAHGQRVLVEYVSANPTGPMNVVSARAAAVGSTLVRLLEATGHVASGEFYVNDAGNQVDLLGESVAARFAERVGIERVFPEQGYRGAYITELAAALPEAEGRARLAAGDPGWFRARALEQMVASQQRDLAHYGVTFDRWFRESELHDSGAVGATLEELKSRGMTYASTHPLEMSEAAQGRAPESSGSGEATYLRTCRFGDDMDRVVVRSNGTPTYLLPDVAYHRDKHARGAAIAINLWGPDHHAYVATMKAALAALGLPPAFLEVLIVQQVNLLSAGQAVKMSKRAGEFVTLRELVDDVGADCAKFFFLMRSTSAHLDFDLDLAKRQNDDNPAFYVQYAHARVASVLRNAAAEGSEPAPGAGRAPLAHAAERTLARMLAVYPEVVRGAAFAREPHRIPVYLQQVAAEFHRFYHECRILADDATVRATRLALADAVRVVLRNGLALMGVSAPERMERAAEVEA